MYTLRPYQQEAVDAVLQHFRKSRAPAVVTLPTGAGKSLVIAELTKMARGRVLVLAHVKELVEQNAAKFESYGNIPGIYSAGLDRKDTGDKAIFGGIQSVARAPKDFFTDYSLLIIDECHRVSEEGSTQYREVITRLLENSPELCVLGLTATPYRLDSGWIYRYNTKGRIHAEEPRFFEQCIYDLPLSRMIREKYLTPIVQIDAPVASYDFSSLPLIDGKRYAVSDIEAILKDQRRITPIIVQNIVELSEEREGVIIFTSSVRHAEEVKSYLPEEETCLIVGDTPSAERDTLIQRFKNRELKFLVNVSVLTTGFDAPHVDLIAILRPTESISLYQQIVGRGLRLSEGKEDCLVLDYTGVPHDIFSPEIADKRPSKESVPVKVSCPQCEHENDFWGITDESGEVVEHFGKKCRGAMRARENDEIIPCGYRYRFRGCEACGAENDTKATHCSSCGEHLVDNATKLKEARASKDAHVMRPDTMTFEAKSDKRGKERLEVRYYDLDGEFLSEVFFLGSTEERKAFYYNFARFHSRLPEKRVEISSVDEAIEKKESFRLPLFVIARKQQKYWKVREKIFW